MSEYYFKVDRYYEITGGTFYGQKFFKVLEELEDGSYTISLGCAGVVNVSYNQLITLADHSQEIPKLLGMIKVADENV